MDRVPECPRCGYDQSGIVAAWKNACPLDGVCRECGLDFAWLDLLSPSCKLPTWSYEHGLRRLPLRWLQTLWRSLFPWWMWRELTLVNVVRPARLALFAIETVLVTHLAVIVFIVATNAGRPSFVIELRTHWLGILLWPYGQEFYIRYLPTSGSVLDLAMLTAFVPTVIMPLPMLLLGQTFRRVRVRPVHLLRGLCYSIPSASVAMALSAASLLGIDQAVLAGLLKDDTVMLEIALLLGPLCLGVWWWFFVNRYLRLPHPLAVVVLMLLTTVLGSMVLLILLALLIAVVTGQP